MHNNKIIHRNLKARNILFIEKDNSIKLDDFIYTDIFDQPINSVKSIIDDAYYAPPEILKGNDYTLKSDIWSLGILLYQITALQMPITASDLEELYSKIKNFKKVPPLPKQYSSILKNLISSMLKVEESKRPAIDDLLEHKVIQPRIKLLMGDKSKDGNFRQVRQYNQILKGTDSKKQALRHLQCDFKSQEPNRSPQRNSPYLSRAKEIKQSKNLPKTLIQRKGLSKKNSVMNLPKNARRSNIFSCSPKKMNNKNKVVRQKIRLSSKVPRSINVPKRIAPSKAQSPKPHKVPISGKRVVSNLSKSPKLHTKSAKIMKQTAKFGEVPN